MNRSLGKKLDDLEVEFLWRRISGKVKAEARETWDEKAWESLPMALIAQHEEKGDRITLAPEQKVRSILRRAVTIPMFRGMYSDRDFQQTIQKAKEASEAREEV